MLRHEVAARRKDVRKEGVFGEFDGVAVVEDCDRQLQHAGIRLHFPVAANGDVHRDRTVVAVRVIERNRLVPDRPFARSEITERQKRADRKQNRNSPFHLGPRKVFRTGLGSWLLPNIRHGHVTGRPKVVN